jgi:hypothetical protein
MFVCNDYDTSGGDLLRNFFWSSAFELEADKLMLLRFNFHKLDLLFRQISL